MVGNILKKGSAVLTSKQYTILSAAFVIGLIYSFSAVLGLIKIRTLSTIFGDSTELGLYFAADDIPTLIFSLIVSGSLSSAFIPIFNKYYKKDSIHAWEITSSVMNISLGIFLVFSLLIIWQADFVVQHVLARNSNLSVVDLHLLADLMKIMMVAQILFIFSNIFTSVLQSFNTFVIPALAPVAYNVGIILSLIFLHKSLGIYAPAVGMVIGAALHLGIQLPAIRSTKFKYHRVIKIKDLGVREIYKLMIPKSLGQIVEKLITPLYTNLALFISGSSNVILSFATDLQSLPIRLFGMSMAQAALPIFSKSAESENKEEFRKLLVTTLLQVIFFILPISIVIFVLKVPLVRLAIGAKRYSWEATVMTAYTLGFYSLSLIAQASVLILSMASYALRDTRTPVLINVFSLIINAALAILFIRFFEFGIWSLAFAFAIASYINAALLGYFLWKKLKSIDILSFLRPLNKIGITSAFTALALYIPLQTMDKLLFDTTKTIWLLVLTACVGIIGGFTYIFFSWVLGVQELQIVTNTYKRLRSRSWSFSP